MIKSAILLYLQLHVKAFAQNFVNQPALETLQSQKCLDLQCKFLYIYIL